MQITEAFLNLRYFIVPGMGLEPTRPTGHGILSAACLPIPSSRHLLFQYVKDRLKSFLLILYL